VAFAGASGYLDMNVYKRSMILTCCNQRLMADSCHNFTEFWSLGMTPTCKQRSTSTWQQSLHAGHALSPGHGYDKASQIAHHAFEHDLTLRQAALTLGYVV
jgi:fumarate hydratase class II